MPVLPQRDEKERVSWKIGADVQLVVGLDGSDVLKLDGAKYSWVTLLENG